MFDYRALLEIQLSVDFLRVVQFVNDAKYGLRPRIYSEISGISREANCLGSVFMVGPMVDHRDYSSFSFFSFIAITASRENRKVNRKVQGVPQSEDAASRQEEGQKLMHVT